MALQELLNLSYSGDLNKIGISEERITAVKPALRQYFAFWREYPDIFIDFLQRGRDHEKKVSFNLFFYQRVFLRIAMRYKYVYAVYPRAYSKSFLSVMTLMLRAILYPRCNLFTTAGGKQQSSQILAEKIQDICTKIPALHREINWVRGGGTTISKDRCIIQFKNGSTIENVAAKESSRGLRKHAGLIEECVGVDQKMLQEVIIPLMNVSRRCMDGTTQENEVLNQSQLYITTAGYKNSFSYDKLIQTLVQMIIEPEKAFIMGGTWRIPVVSGLQSPNFINDLKKDPTFNQASFEREYESKWSGVVEDAFFNGEAFDRNRILQKPEYEVCGRNGNQQFYVISVDVGRKGCQSVACVLKVNPQPMGTAIKNLVNIYTYGDMHFEEQAIELKKLYYKYKAKRLVIDGNGLGIGLIDYMVKSQTDSFGDTYPPFMVYNDDERFYRKFRTADCEDNAIYLIKANAPINTEAYSIVQTQLEGGKLKFLIEEKVAKNKLLGTKMGTMMSPEARNEYLMPYELTSILKMEMLNLRQDNEGINIILKQASRSIGHDKFSALCYGLYYIKQEEEDKKRHHKFNAAAFSFMN